MQNSVVYFVYILPRLLKVKFLNNSKLLPCVFLLINVNTNSPFSSTASMNFPTKVTIINYSSDNFCIEYDKKKLALRIFTNNLHRFVHVFIVKFKKEASSKEVKILLQIIYYKHSFGWNNFVLLLMMQLNPYE